MPRFRVTERDLAIIAFVHEYRFVTAAQVHKRFFGGRPSSKTYAESRLKNLFHAGYVGRIPKPSMQLGAPLVVYCLEAKGRDLIAERKGIGKRDVYWERWDNQKSLFFLEHTIALNELRLHLTLAAEAAGHILVSWMDERMLRAASMKDFVDDPAGGGNKIPIVPDGWGQIQLATGKRFSFFVELDRNTEEQKQFARKVRGYLAYWESGAYVKKYQTHSLTVLTVVSGARPTHDRRRVEQLRTWTETEARFAKPETFSELFWFAALANTGPLAVLSQPVWQVAGITGIHQLVE